MTDPTLQAARQALLDLAAQLPLDEAEQLLADTDNQHDGITRLQQLRWMRCPQRQAIALELQWRRQQEQG